jgi:uncharacterized membrane protein HdeD (DUF308 family)
MTTASALSGLEHLRARWGWFLALGILMVVLGAIALVFTPVATLGTVFVLGWLMIVSGIVDFVHAFQARRWGGVLLHLLGGVLGVFVGLLVITHPIAGALVWTMIFAAFFTVLGAFRAIAAVHLRYRSWGWALFDGLVTLALGILLWVQWPVSAAWFLGLALGITLLLRGWTTIMFSFAVRRFADVIPMREEGPTLRTGT